MPFVGVKGAKREEHGDDVDGAGLKVWRKTRRREVPLFDLNVGRVGEWVLLQEVDSTRGKVVPKQGEAQILILGEQREQGGADATPYVCDGDWPSAGTQRRDEFVVKLPQHPISFEFARVEVILVEAVPSFGEVLVDAQLLVWWVILARRPAVGAETGVDEQKEYTADYRRLLSVRSRHRAKRWPYPAVGGENG